MITTSTDFDLTNPTTNETTKSRDIRPTLIWVMTAAFAAVILLDLLG